MSDATLAQHELHDIQGLVTTGYGHLICSRFVFLQIQEPGRVRGWLGQILSEITTSGRRPPGTPKPQIALNIACTHEGLARLGLPDAALNAFPREFQAGMTGGEKPRVLGDTGDSDPALWDMGGPNNETFHLLLLIYALNDDVLNAKYTALEPGFDAGGLKVIYAQDTGRISEKEPFGFRDGISQPYMEGSPGACPHGETPINAGEFLLGYRNAYETVAPTPVIAAGLDPQNVLPPLPDSRPPCRDFGRNGSYLVFRKLAQNVEGFWKYVEEQAEYLGKEANRANSEWIAAKMVGRWPSGAPLTLAPTHDEKSLSKTEVSNDFLFMPTDADGQACPVGSHIRRANPRDSLLPNPERSHVLSNRHRLLRRGRHYEDKRKPGETWRSDGIEQGLCFIALNADIQRQFEFVQQTWLNSTKFNGLYEEKDPLLGDNDGNGLMTIPADPVRQRLCGIPRFVRVRGGGYFFLPGMNALRFLASL